MPKLIHAKLLLILTLLTPLILTPLNAANADPQTVAVNGTIDQTLFFSGCQSPIGECGQGPVTGNILNGQMIGILQTFTPTPTGIAFTATATITTAKGNLYATATLFQNFGSETITATLHITGGTLRYQHTTGILNLTEPAPDVNGVQHYLYTGSLSKDVDQGN